MTRKNKAEAKQEEKEQNTIEINNIEEVKEANKKIKEKTDEQQKQKNEIAEKDTEDQEQDSKTEYEKSLENDINELEQQMQAAKEELETKTADYLKLYAEFDNYRKRTQQEKDEFAQYASGNVIKDLLPVLDSFDQANMSLDKEEVNIADLRDGFSLIYKQLSKLLDDLNVTRIKTVGEKFDPFYHEAVAQTEESDQDEGTIVQEFRSGYMLKDKVLRHAMVVVAK